MRKLCLVLIVGIINLISLQILAQCPPTSHIGPAIASKSIESIKKAIGFISDCNELADSLSLAYHKLGVLYYNVDDWNAALSSTSKAIDIRRSSSDKNSYDLAQSYNNMGVFYKKLERLEKALLYFDSAAVQFASTNLSKYFGSQREQASIYVQLGEYQQAEDVFNLIISRANQEKDTWRAGEAYLDYAGLLNRLGRFKEALDILTLAIPIFTESSHRNAQLNLAAAFRNMANALDGKGQYPEAIQNYQKSIAIFKTFEDKEEIAIDWMNIGISWHKLGNYSNSENSLTKALNSALIQKDASFAAMVYDNLGDLFAKQYKPDLALSYYQKAVCLRTIGFTEQACTEVPANAELRVVANKVDLLIYLTDLAKNLVTTYKEKENENHLADALKYFQQADYLIDQMRIEHSNLESKLFWRQTTRPVYEAALEACYLKGDKRLSFYFMEKSKSILLLEGLLANRALRALPDSIAQRESELKRALFRIKQSLEGQDGSKRDPIQLGKMIEAQVKLDNHLERIQNSYPQYYDTRYKSTVATINQVQNELFLNTDAIIEYFIGVENLYLWYMHKNSVPEFLRINLREEDKEQLKVLLDYFSGKSPTLSPFNYEKISNHLFSQFYAPFFRDSIKKVIIVPDGEFAFLPFEALVVEANSRSNFRQLDYLLKHQTISYGHSATVLLNQINHDYAKELLQIAPAFTNDYDTLAPLIHYQRGLENYKSYILHLKEGANLASFLENAPTSKVVHFTTHAEGGDYPRIYLADTVLTLSDLYSIRLEADLVVLDACATNLGRFNAGEGVMSLARGFTYAGAESLISSLWEVDDLQTQKLFRNFYDLLGSGVTKAKALQQAKLEFISKADLDAWTAPSAWAGFVYLGSDHSLLLQKKSALARFQMTHTLLSFLLLGIIGGIIIFLFLHGLDKKNIFFQKGGNH